MTFNEEQKVGLNIAFDENALIGAEFDSATQRLGLTPWRGEFQSRRNSAG